MNEVKSLTIVMLIVSCVSVCGAQQSQKRIALTANSTVSSGEVLDILHKKGCSGVVLTGEASAADYMLEVEQRGASNKLDTFTSAVSSATGTNGNQNDPKHNPAIGRQEYTATLFSLKGEVLYNTKTHIYSVTSLTSAVLGACKAIGQQKSVPDRPTPVPAAAVMPAKASLPSAGVKLETVQPVQPTTGATPIMPATAPSPAEAAERETVPAVQPQPTTAAAGSTPTGTMIVLDNGGESLGDAARRMRQRKACLELAKDNASIICK